MDKFKMFNNCCLSTTNVFILKLSSRKYNKNLQNSQQKYETQIQQFNRLRSISLVKLFVCFTSSMNMFEEAYFYEK